MTSLEAKVALLSYCRFARQYHYVATEVSIAEGLADVLASDGKNLVEYEIKVSIQDLLRDKEKPKHLIYDTTPILWNENNGTKGDIKIEIVQGRYPRMPERWNAVARKDGKNDFLLGSYYGYGTAEEAKQEAEKKYGSVKNAPNTMYYVIPTLLWEKYQEKILADLHPSYGIITFSSHGYNSMQVVRKAKKLHKRSFKRYAADARGKNEF